MKYIRNITIGLVCSFFILQSCNNSSNPEDANILIEKNRIMDYFHIGNNWEIVEYKSSLDEYLEMTIEEYNNDTVRRIKLYFGINQKTLPYFNCDSFHYAEEKIFYFDQDSNYYEIQRFYNDTLYHFEYDNERKTGFIVKDYERYTFHIGEEFYKIKYTLGNVNERNAFYVKGLWGLKIGSSSYQIRFNSDSIFINESPSNNLVSMDKYEIHEDVSIYLNGPDLRAKVITILPLNLIVEFNDSIFYANRISY